MAYVKFAYWLMRIVEAIFTGVSDANKKLITARLIGSKIFKLNEETVARANQAAANADAAVVADPGSLRNESGDSRD